MQLLIFDFRGDTVPAFLIAVSYHLSFPPIINGIDVYSFLNIQARLKREECYGMKEPPISLSFYPVYRYIIVHPGVAWFSYYTYSFVPFHRLESFFLVS